MNGTAAVSPASTERPLASKAALAVSAVALVAATLAARADPATNYEVSIYAATPLLFWAGAAVAFACSLGVALLTRSRGVRRLALLLGGLTFAAVVALPLIRGYAFHGVADSLSHVGWVRDVVAGRLALPGLLYPGLHGTALFTRAVTGATITRVMMLVPLVYVLLFAVGIPVAVRSITDDATAVVVGTFSAFMLLPINNISASMTAHPSTMAILFTPFVLAVITRYLREPEGAVTATGAALALCSVALVLVHPQQAANLLLLLGTVAGVQFLRRRRGRNVHRRVYGQVAFLGVVLLVWSLGHERIGEASTGLVASLLNGGVFTGEGSAIAQRSASLLAIGASLQELFVKLFLVSAVYAALTLVAMLASADGRLGDELGEDVVVPFSVGLLPVGALFVLYLVAGIDTMYFRHLGFIMALVTVLGTVGIAFLVRRRGSDADRLAPRSHTVDARGARSVVAVVVAAMLLLSVPVIYQSPYMYKPTMHITEQSLEGHETAFEYASEGVEIYGVREGPDRYRDALTGTGNLDSDSYREAHGVPAETLESGLTEAYDRRIYFLMTQLDRGREDVAFENLRYSDRALSGVGNEPGVHRVMSNGGVELYLVS